MKKRSKIIISSVAVIIFGIYISFFAPYNLYKLYTANSFGVLFSYDAKNPNGDTKGIKSIDELYMYFKDYNISKIKYLGSDSYEVFTDKGDFTVIADYSDNDIWKYKIFKHETDVQHFPLRMQ